MPGRDISHPVFSQRVAPEGVLAPNSSANLWNVSPANASVLVVPGR